MPCEDYTQSEKAHTGVNHFFVTLKCYVIWPLPLQALHEPGCMNQSELKLVFESIDPSSKT